MAKSEGMELDCSRSDRSTRSRFKRRGSLLAGSGCTLLISPTDPKHQKSPAFYPDKLKEWDSLRPGHVQENMFTLGDNVHFEEIASMKMSLMAVQERGTLPDWACVSIRTWWEHHYEWVLSRADCLRDYWIPLFEARFHYPRVLKDALFAYIRQLHKISKTIQELHQGDGVDDLLNEWVSYEESVLSYKTYNGNMGIMLYHAYFSPEEDTKHKKNMYQNYYTSSKTIRENFMRQKTPGFIPAIVHSVGEDVFRGEIMPREKLLDILWDAVISNPYKEYTDKITPHTDALLTGIAPAVCTSVGEEDYINFGLEQFLSLDPFDPEYQRDISFPPEKLWGWNETLADQINNGPRTIVDNAKRFEANQMKKSLLAMKSRGRPLVEWEITSFQKIFSLHYGSVYQLFYYTLKVLFPFLEQRINLPSIFKESRGACVESLQLLHTMVDGLKVGDRVDPLLDMWNSYENRMSFAHSQDPLRVILYHSYFSKEEHVSFLASKILSGLLEDAPGSVIYYLGKDRFRKCFMKQEELGDLNWHLKFASQYIDYVENTVVHIKALEQGSPPKKQNWTASRILLFLESNLSDECLDQNSILNRFSKSFQKVEETTAAPEDDTLSNLIDSLSSEFREKL